MADEAPKPRPARPCPVCRRPAVEQFRPFCSARCRQVDLGRWLTEGYTIPGEKPESGDDETG